MASSSNAGSIVEKTYSTTVQYAPGKFPYGKVDDVYFSSSSPALKARQAQKVMQLVSKPSQEKVLKKIILGKDGRKRVQNTTKYPYSIHVQIDMKFGNGMYGGSGSLVGPHHVLTCGHNVYDVKTKKWATEITVHPGRNRQSAPFGQAKVTKAYTFRNYTNNREYAYDIALLILDKSIGKYTGWGGLCSAPDSALKAQTFSITGYPGDKGCSEMWEMSYKVKAVEKEMFHYEIDTFAGQSGSAIWVKDGFGAVKIMGVHTLGDIDINSGVRISNDKFNKLFREKISSTYKIRKESLSGSILSTSKPPLPKEALGKAVWQKHFKNVEGVEGPLPANIEEILNVSTPFKIEGFSSWFWSPKVRDTHILAWIPERVNGLDVSLDGLNTLFKYRYYDSSVRKLLGSQKLEKATWVLISKNVLEGSRKKTYDQQKKIMSAYASQGYTLPKALEVTAALLIHERETKKRLLTDNPWTYTRCQERLNNNRIVSVGGFATGGLYVNFSPRYAHERSGIVSAQNL